MSKTEIIAHRGASFDAPENTLTAVNLAWEQDVDAIEIDIRRSSDGRIMVIHDKDLRRLTGENGSPMSRTAAELRRMDVGSWKHPRFAGERIPFLEEVLETVPEGKKLCIEIKDSPEVVPALRTILERSGKKAKQIVLIGFSFETMLATKESLPQLQTHWLQEIKKYVRIGKPVPTVEQLIAQTQKAGFDALSFDSEWPVDAALIHAVKKTSLGFHVWTVDDPAFAQFLVEEGVDGITSNRAAWLREKLLFENQLFVTNSK